MRVLPPAGTALGGRRLRAAGPPCRRYGGQRAWRGGEAGDLRVDGGERAALERVGLGEAGRGLAGEEVVALDGLNQHEAHQLAEVAAAELVLEGLEVRAQVHHVEVLVPPRHRQDALAEHAHFRVDQHVLGFVVP